jgi:hypothetical protein
MAGEKTDVAAEAEMMEQLKKLYGDLEPGTVLMFRETYRALKTNEKVFLHFEDDRMIYPRAQGDALYLTVPKTALQWHQSLTPQQIQEFVARRAAK